MNYTIIIDKDFKKKARKFLIRHPELRNQYGKTLKILELDIYHPSLRLHKINTKRDNFYSISVNMSYRITLDLITKDKEIILLNIGNHDEIY